MSWIGISPSQSQALDSSTGGESVLMCLVKDGPKPEPAAKTSGVNIDKAIDHLHKNFVLPFGHGKCAKHVIDAINASGGNVERGHAYQLGPKLEKAGFSKFPTKPSYADDSSQWQRGDVVVIQEYGNIYGHTAMYDGTTWITDFPHNKGDLWGGKAARAKRPPFEVYRP